MRNIYSVSQINYYIRDMFAQDYLLRSVSVRGEISNCKYHTSGHIYFNLKDENAVISCIMFAGSRAGLRMRLQDGQKVIAAGRIGIYERGGTYQLYVSDVQAEGLGELYVRYEALKRELEEMGMFDPGYKQPIPAYIRTLGVVTAPTGAAVRDIIQISRRRNPGIRIILYPAKVQGEGAAESIAAGIAALEEAGVDAMIIGRGGGSIEDLWAFNEEIVAKAVFACTVPVISAVGHETDTVISDFVADLRAPTPSAAAELAVADMSELMRRLSAAGGYLRSVMESRISSKRSEILRMKMQLELSGPSGVINSMRHHLAALDDTLFHAMQMKLAARRTSLERLQSALKALSPYARLLSGYAYVEDEDGKRIVRAAQAKQGRRLYVRFADGEIAARIEDIVLHENE